MAERRSGPTGYVLVDKPAGPSSNGAVQAVRRTLGIGGRRGTKGGHAGTLDPFASGLLLVLLGHATRLMPHVVGHDKDYLVTVTFGASSDTDDSEGELTPSDAPLPTFAAVEAACRTLAASTSQVPPAVSAIHIDGKRAYARVRDGETFEVPPRAVRFDRIEPLAHGADADAAVATVTLDVRCGSGTYMRALARDLGELVGCPAHCSALRRTMVGEWDVADAVALDQVTAADVRPIAQLGLLPTLQLEESDIDHILHGRAISCEQPVTSPHIALDPGRSALAVVEPREDGRLQPRILLVNSPSVSGSAS